MSKAKTAKELIEEVLGKKCPNCSCYHGDIEDVLKQALAALDDLLATIGYASDGIQALTMNWDDKEKIKDMEAVKETLDEALTKGGG